MSRIIVFIYGVIAYILFFIAILYAIGFVGNFVVPKSIDSGLAVPLGEALLVNLILLGLFALQHTIMARQGFKNWITKIIPVSAERSTFVLFFSLILLLLYWQWRPIHGVVWEVENSVAINIIYALFVIGWLQVFVTTFLINHFDLFGLSQVIYNLRQKEYHHPPFCYAITI
jgi:protein-S-isoprenylcysteine O-methyltransferase Ste14